MNYYNYFTEVEDHFRRARDSGMYMMSPLDWALVEAWKDGGVPLEAVLKGIDRAFAKFHAKPRRVSMVNSVAYCTQEIMAAAKNAARTRSFPHQQARPGLERSRLVRFFRERAGRLRELASDGAQGEVFEQTAATLEGLAEQAETNGLGDLEDLERRLTVLEDRVVGVALGSLSEEQMLSARRDLDAQLAPYRRKLGAVQLSMLEQRHTRRTCLEAIGLPRLSLFFVE